MTMMLLQMLDMTHEDELSCGEVHELVDQYIDLKESGENVDDLMPLLVRKSFDAHIAHFQQNVALAACFVISGHRAIRLSGEGTNRR